VRATIGVPGRVAVSVVLLGYPALTGIGWTALRSWHIDLAMTLAAMGTVVIATAVVRTAWLLHTHQHPAPFPPPRQRADRDRHATQNAELVA
jgi:hypothetical protein